MAGETLITVIGNLTADPELRATQSGVQVASFTIASTPRTFDRQANEWKDGEALFMRCSAWRDLGEHVAASLGKGNRVIASGFLKPKSYKNREGVDVNTIELDVQEIGPSLLYATASVVRAARGGGGGQQQAVQQQGGGQYGPPQGQQYGPPQGQQGPPQQGFVQPQAYPAGGGFPPAQQQPMQQPMQQPQQAGPPQGYPAQQPQQGYPQAAPNMTQPGQGGPAVPPISADYGDNTPF